MIEYGKNHLMLDSDSKKICKKLQIQKKVPRYLCSRKCTGLCSSMVCGPYV